MIFPGDVAIFSPKRKAFMSVMVIASRPPPRPRSSSKFSRPRSRFCPPDSRVARENLWVGRNEVRGGDGIHELAGVEIDLPSGSPVHALDVADGRKNRFC